MESIPLLFVGSYHMHNPGLDTVNLPADDPRSLRRQPEILRVVKGLAGFMPTHVALEFEPKEEPGWNERFQAWRRGTFTLTANEICQLGFQVAGAVGLDRLHGIDWNGESGYGPRPDPGDVLRWIETHRPDAFVRIAALLPNPAEFSEAQARSSVGKLLWEFNQAESLLRAHRLYLEIAQVVSGEDFVGAEWVAGYYRRNLFIFARLAALAEPGNRILVIYGQGHIPFLRHFAEASGRFVLEDPRRYLPA